MTDDDLSTPTTALDAPPDSTGQKRRFTLWGHLFLSGFWLAYSLQWGALLPVILPDQIASIVGPDKKETFNGLILSLGSVVALFVTPIAGALSDRSQNRFGRRRPFLLVGALINVLFLFSIAGFGKGSNIWLFALLTMGVQFGCNAWGGPYSGLIPDVVPEEQRGTASGWMAVMSALGTILGSLSAGQLVRDGQYWAAYGVIILTILVTLTLTLLSVRETRNLNDPGPFRLGQFLRSFLLDPTRYRDFYWVMVTRGMITMGVYSVLGFFQYFLGDVIRVSDPVKASSYLVGIITLLSIPMSMIAGPLSDRYGRKPLIYFSGGLMSLAAGIFIFVAFVPSMAFTFVIGALFGMGYGAYLAVDWALAIDVLPSHDSAAKDMGIWHVGMAIPQILAPAISGVVLNALKPTSLLAGYTAVFAMAAFWFLMGTVFVRQIRGVK